MNSIPLSAERNEYSEILQHAVAVIEHARTGIAKHVNVTVASAYWEIGKLLHERKIESGHGDSVVKRLSEDLKERYPKMGISPRQLWNMKKYYERYAGHDEKVQRSVALLPWSHNLMLLSKGLNDEATLYYAQETVTKGWNRDLLLNAIKLNMYETQALARADNRSIGIILCAEKDRVEVKLALEDMGKPIGVADYQLIVPKEKLQKVLTDEINAFSEEKENDTKKG